MGKSGESPKSADGKVVGERMTADRRMSTTNGIDLSPDGKTLYVGESDTREIWSYRIDGTRLLSPGLLKRFDDFDIDGLRTDVDGQSPGGADTQRAPSPC